MLSRTARRLETTLLLSRQSLPRPARLSPRHYSAPSKPAHHPAAATATQPSPAYEYPAYFPHASSSSSTEPAPSGSTAHNSDLVNSFLQRQARFTILPAPLPKGDKGEDPIFTDTLTQDKLAVMDACLHNHYNVSRARTLFNGLRESNANILTTEVYNRILAGYFKMGEKEEVKRMMWVHEAWKVYREMCAGREPVRPDTSTYALVLASCHQFSLDGKMPVDSKGAMSYEEVLDNIRTDTTAPSLLEIVAHPALSSDAATIMQELSRISLANRDVNTVNTLARAASIASGAETHEFPEVKSVLKEHKDADGNVTSEVPFNIQNLRDHLAYVAYAKHVMSDDMVARQRHLELNAYEMAADRITLQTEKLASLGMDGRFRDKVLQEYMYTWHEKLSEKLRAEVKMIEKEEFQGKFRNHHTELTPYLSLVAADRLSMITILEVMRLTGTGGIAAGMKTTRAIVSIGKAVENEYKARMCRANNITMPDTSKPDENVFTEFGYSNLYERRLATAKQMGVAENWTAQWSQLTRAQVGGVLLECLMDVAKVVKTAPDRNTGKPLYDNQPAFYHGYEYVRGTKLGVIKVNSAVTERIAKDPLKGTIHPRYLPMLIPPKPWVGTNQGAYLFSRAHLMRFKDSVEQEKYIDLAVAKGNIELVMEGLNMLGRTPWNINKQVFDVVLEVWNTGKRVGKIPPAVYDHPEPTPPADETDLAAQSAHIQQMRAFQQALAGNHSDRCSVNYKIEIARAFANETIYFPHNLDFRGRAYPIPVHLNHIGDDLCRGLLRFAKAKPLGVRGFRWLKIHLANLYGFDKADFDERVEWVHERVDKIKDSAHNPMTGERWWMGADDPWQCLAVCFELTAALESGDPLNFESSLPVHQDGTCNGLQHYAAMGGDSVGAAQVNLAPVDRPSDVYTFVGQKVEKIIERDAALGNEIAQALVGKITRKLVKQTVMTTVYGVTFVGAREQLQKQLKDRGDLSEAVCWDASAYLAKNVLMSIGEAFKGAKEIQNYLNLCARVISKSISPDRFRAKKEEVEARRTQMQKARKGKAAGRGKKEAAAAGRGSRRGRCGGGGVRVTASAFKKEQMTSVIWTTALGLPIVQPYRKTIRKQVMTNLQSVFISDPNVASEVNTVKQATAFPPNFVHSLDATHMMLSAIEASNKGLTFAAVHDSYWTHACDIDLLSTIIRDTFINLHSSDMLKRLHDEFLERYRGYLIPVLHLQENTTLNKRLVEAGVKVKMTPEQAKAYSLLGNLIEVVDKVPEAGPQRNMLGEDVVFVEGTVDGNAPRMPSDEEIAKEALKALAKRELVKEEGEGVEGSVEAVEEDVEERRARMEAERNLMNKFVDLTAVLPPLPEKGSFDVRDIRKSLYFFS
ncbi:mitochondrial RNA polymerase [Ephemerocybe angulata]|uniref:DNA-directed RNA polymerase n=1 Tax=Ephemerocybe angulata TaxID=980116 RepID=A0A8H6HM76_9AGAR|nr:mitochondrial RNA polymerase [Tulosesus angulatus]